MDDFSAQDNVMIAQVPARTGVCTLYARFGDGFAWICIAGLAACIGSLVARTVFWHGANSLVPTAVRLSCPGAQTGTAPAVAQKSPASVTADPDYPVAAALSGDALVLPGLRL